MTRENESISDRELEELSEALGKYPQQPDVPRIKQILEDMLK